MEAHRNTFRRGWLALICLLLALITPRALSESLDVDYDYLKAAVPNSVGWLYQPDAPINQPIMYSQNAGYYLRHRFDGQYSGSGALYVTGNAPPTFGERVVILRGVNRMDCTLMGSLSLYREEGYYEQHPTLYLLTPNQNYRLDVFAGIRVKHTDHTSWVVPSSNRKRYAMMSELLESSFITPKAELLPTEEDAWALLTTEDRRDEGNRYVLYTRKRPIERSGEDVVYINQMEMDSRTTRNGYATVAGVGTWMIYAQNDTLWKRLTFEVPNSTRQRPFGDGGCGPTAVAMALVNLVKPEDLPRLGKYASDPLGYRFCSCCIGSSWCYRQHVPYQLTRPEEYLRYFPLAVAEFAMGNNVFGAQGRYDSYGTNMSYLESICKAYDIQYDRTRDVEEALAFLQEPNTMIVTCATGPGTPFTRSSHFLVLAEVKDGYLYVLDPIRRASYAELDPQGILEKLAPGLVRLRVEDISRCHFYPYHLLKAPD